MVLEKIVRCLHYKEKTYGFMENGRGIVGFAR